MSQEISAPDFIQPASIDFSSLHEKAMAHSAGNDTPASTTEPTAVDSPSPVTTGEAPSAAASVSPAEAKVLDLPEDALVKVKIDGVEQTVPYREFQAGVQREAVFTKRMQTLADQRREAEQAIASRAAEVERQAQMIAYAQQQLQQAAMARNSTPAAETVKSPDPNEIATLGEVQESLRNFQQQIAAQQAEREQLLMQQLQQAGQQLRDEQAIQADALRFSKALQSTLDTDSYKLLRDVIPFAEESIRFKVAELNPQTMDEAIEMMDQVVQEWAGKVQTATADSLKRHEVAKARAKIEPPSGSPVPPSTAQPRSFMRKQGGMDWDVLRERATALADRM